MTMDNIVLLGIGQSFRGDDAIGIIAVEKWQERFPETAQLPALKVEILELPGLELLDALSGAKKALIVDAVQSGSPTGTIHVITENELLSFTPDSQSAHGWGVAETLKLGALLEKDDLPKEIVIIGIEADQFEMGAGLSPTVSNQIQKIVEIIQTQIIQIT
ncbi:MAG: hydrogenase maturation protease [Chloroflexota bacterium]